MRVDNKALTEAVEKYLAGDGYAFNDICSMTFDAGVEMAYSVVKDRDTAQDVVQDSYIKVLNHIRTDLTDPSGFMKWFNTIIINTGRNYLRKKKPLLYDDFTFETDDGDELSLIDTIPDEGTFELPGTMLEKNELCDDVRAAIDDLSDDKRLVVTMRVYEELSFKEIADILGVNENTVKSRMNQAKKDLAKALEGLEKKYGGLFAAAPLSMVRWAFDFNSERNGLDTERLQAILAEVQNAGLQDPSLAQRFFGRFFDFFGDIAEKVRTLFDGGVDPKTVAATVIAAGVIVGGAAAGTKAVRDRSQPETTVPASVTASVTVPVSQVEETTRKPVIEPPTFDFDEEKAVDNEVEVKELRYGVKGAFQAFSDNGEVVNVKPLLDRKNFRASYDELLPAVSENSVKFAGEISEVLGAVEALGGKELETDAVLSEQAGVRAEEIAWSARDYSVRPDGTDYTTVFEHNGITEGTRDEIIIYRAKSVDEAVKILQKSENAEKLTGSVSRIGIGAAEEPESGELVFVVHSVSDDVRSGDILGQIRARMEYRKDNALDNQIDGITDTITDIQALEERVADIPILGDILLYDFNTDEFEMRAAERFDKFLEWLDEILPR